MIGQLLDLIGRKYPLTPVDVGEYAALRANRMKFSISAYKAQGLGHVSVMRAKGFFGMMNMDTLMVTPVHRDLPLYSYDRIHAFGNDTLIVELYRTLLGAGYDDSALQEVKQKYAFLPSRDPGQHWYDDIKLSESLSLKGKKKETPHLDALALAHLQAYLCAPCLDVEDVEAKRQACETYAEGLLTHGGPSTDVFMKALGEEQTRMLFTHILFGTAL